MAIGFNHNILFSDGTNLQVDQPANHSYSTIDVGGSSLNPADFVASSNGSEVYFVGSDATLGGPTLWETNGTAAGTVELGYSWTTSNPAGDAQIYDHGQMATLNGALYFNGSAAGDPSSHDLVAFNGSSFSTVATGLNPVDMISATVGVAGGKTVTDLFFNGKGDNQTGTGDLYVNNGSSSKDIGKGLHPTDLTSLTYTSSAGQRVTDVFFDGTDSSGKQGLFMVTANGSGGLAAPTEIAVNSSQVASSGLDPNDLTVCNGKLYFAGSESASFNPSGVVSPSDSTPEGLWVYDPNAGGSASLVDATYASTGKKETVGGSHYDLNVTSNPGSLLTMNPQPQMAASGNDVYFTANSGNTVGGLFAYNTVTNTVFTHIGGTNGATPYNLTSVHV
jgi:hypothetical protein